MQLKRLMIELELKAGTNPSLKIEKGVVALAH